MDLRLGLIGLVAAAAVAAAVAANPQGVPPEAPKSDVAPATDRLDYFMARKLQHAQGLFGALAVEDFAAASQEAQKLGLLCLDEGWNVIQTPEYAERTVEFRRTIAAVDRAARDRDLPAAQLEYLQLAGQCFSCHKALRARTEVKERKLPQR